MPTSALPIIAAVDRRAIQQLPASLVNRIAAGEVIERPASVVKELVENAIDAGATEILIETEDGGREVMRVTDNGCGIPADELLLAFAEHATNKITCDEDLFSIGTMGFRGEALASIGSVSHAKILTRTADSDAAYEVSNRGGLVSDVQAAAGNVGTTVEIRNLFFNTPARRKFLKGAATESGHISDIILRLALPHPQIAFKLISGNRTALDLPAGAEEERLLAAWPDSFREQRLPIESRDAEVRLRGLIALPEAAGPTAKHQYFYLNGRHIRDKFIQHALRESYRGLTEPGRQPAGILLITMPAQDVDVNVHPTKSEVRFKDSGRIHGLVMSVIRERLLGSDLTPRAVPAASMDTEREEMRSKLAFFLRVTEETPGPSSPDETITAAESRALTSPFSMSSLGPPPQPTYAVAEVSASNTPLVSAPARLPALQLHNSYLVTESNDGLVIIDQHALHERIMYEDLLARIGRGPLESQRLLIPALIKASQRQLSVLDQIGPLLQKLGIEISAFGPDTVAVHSFPTFLDKLDPEKFVTELLERGEQELLDLHQEEVLHELLDMMACKAAVKAGDPLTAGEIEAMLARRELIERSSNCPHGRPTTLRLSLRDLEKQFKRTGF